MKLKKIEPNQLEKIDYTLYKFMLECIFQENKNIEVIIYQDIKATNTIIFKLTYKEYILRIISKETQLTLYKQSIASQKIYDKITLDFVNFWTLTTAKILIYSQIQMLS